MITVSGARKYLRDLFFPQKSGADEFFDALHGQRTVRNPDGSASIYEPTSPEDGDADPNQPKTKKKKQQRGTAP